MKPLHDAPEDCLARAEYAADQAQRARTAEDRRHWLEIAREWRTLAKLKRDSHEAFSPQ